jgi:hypothetical protein
MGINRTRPDTPLTREEHYAKNLRDRFDPAFCNYDGLEHGLGWLGLIHTLHYSIAHVVPDYVIYQIKEKFGTLRFYYTVAGDLPDDASLDKICALVDEAERQSSTTCEVCGDPGATTERKGWWFTRCGECKAKIDGTTNTDPA